MGREFAVRPLLSRTRPLIGPDLIMIHGYDLWKAVLHFRSWRGLFPATKVL